MRAECIIVGISGGSGSGKTLVAGKVMRLLGKEKCALIAQDRYYKDRRHLPVEERESLNFDHPDSIDWGLFLGDLISLHHGRFVHAPVYDFTRHIRTSTRIISAAPVIVAEGHLLFHHRDLREQMDFKVFIDLDEDLLLERRIRRDVGERNRTAGATRRQYFATVRPMFFEYVMPSRRWADKILHGEDSPESLAREIVEVVRTMTDIVPLPRRPAPGGRDR